MKYNYFNFKEFDNMYLLTNDFGSYIFVSRDEFARIIRMDIASDPKLELKLLNKRMIYDTTNLEYSSLQKQDLRRIKGHVTMATSLHIFVITTACNMRCIYCQANNGITFSAKYMSIETAEKAVDIALQSPTKHLSFEFQGGEPLLNYGTLKHIIEYTERHNNNHEIQYNVVTNLTLITDEQLEFLSEHKVGISTSFDGPEYVHNANRPFESGAGTYSKVIDSLELLRGKGLRVGAIQTTTRASLPYPREIINTYNEIGFDSIFIRPLTPLGKATLNWNEIGYTPEEFMVFYTQALDELIRINIAGHYLKENHAAILLSKIAGNFVNYMELRSPCGAGIGQLAYYADGNIFTCDEGRMLHEMGDHTFKIGNVFADTYASIINNSVSRSVCASSILETIPTCCDCVYQPYCGTCPVVNYAKEQDIIEKEPRGYRCMIYSGMLDYLFKLFLESNDTVINTLNAWSN